MPFTIIRGEVTRVKADAVVSFTDTKALYAGRTDMPVYKAAGAMKLFLARRKIGRIAEGEAAATPAFRLPARFIIHTAAPAWQDGQKGERGILRDCCKNSLALAERLGCESIAFPLGAAGLRGFPGEDVLNAVLSAVREYLEHAEMDITLAVPDGVSLWTEDALTGKVGRYINENGALEQVNAAYAYPREELSSGGTAAKGQRERRQRPGGEAAARASAAQRPAGTADDTAVARPSLAGPHMSMPPCPATDAKKASLEEAVGRLGESFRQRLLRMIDERGMTDPEVYKRANLDRKLFSKIRSIKNYTPRKRTILALAVAMQLNIDDTRDLLASAGYALSNSSRTDLIVSFCIDNGIYDIFEVNALLFRFGEPVLG